MTSDKALWTLAAKLLGLTVGIGLLAIGLALLAWWQRRVQRRRHEGPISAQWLHAHDDVDGDRPP